MRLLPLLVPVACALLAATAPTFLFALWTGAKIEEPWNIVVASQTLALTRWVFIIALAHALILGLPLYLLLRLGRHVGVVACAAGGFLIGAVPLGLWLLGLSSGRYNASTGNTPTVIDGVRTVADWIEYGQEVGLFGLYGLAGGLTFWGVLRLAGQRSDKFRGPAVKSESRGARAWVIICAGGLLTCALLAAPSVIRDNSCHNLFRDGRTSLNPQIFAELEVPAEDWQTLRQTFVDFAAAHSLSLRSDQQIQNGITIWRELSLCNDAGVNFELDDQPWTAQMSPPVEPPRMTLSIFELKANSGWSSLARELLTKIEQTWPQKTTFRGPSSKDLSLEEALKGRP